MEYDGKPFASFIFVLCRKQITATSQQKKNYLSYIIIKKYSCTSRTVRVTHSRSHATKHSRPTVYYFLLSEQILYLERSHLANEIPKDDKID